MALTFIDFYRWDGRVNRAQYALTGIVALAIKHNLDRLIAWSFHYQWNWWSYWYPVNLTGNFGSFAQANKTFLTVLFVTALPFIWIGLLLTIKRLRDAGKPLWLTVLFFAPVVNLIFFAILSVLPSQADALQRREFADTDAMPQSAWGSAIMAVAVTSGFGVVLAWFSITLLGAYGWTLFFALPFAMGYLSVWIYSFSRRRSWGESVLVVTLTLAVVALGIAAIAIEGLVCLLMATPIAWILALLGGGLAHVIHNKTYDGLPHTNLMGIVVLAVPMLFGVEQVAPPPVPRFEVKTSIEIAAPPEIVWKRIIAFPQLPAAREWPFRLGIAYPLAASITGEGLTAHRECRFSTGSFTEPILAWEPAKHFAFGVAQEPLLMRETSPYGNIAVRHLTDHDFAPERADFRLVPLAGGGTRLEGTTTYRNKMWPGEYWRLWTDAIVHNIHRRVFEHVKRLAEADVQR